MTKWNGGVWVTLLIGVDIVTKWATSKNLAGQFNKGIAFGWLESEMWVFVSLCIVIWAERRVKLASSFTERSGWLLVISGGGANLIDRVRWGQVWDWIYYPHLRFVGNLADVYIFLGVVLVILATELPKNNKSIAITYDRN